MDNDINLHDALEAVFGRPQKLAKGISAYNMPRFQLGQCVATQGALGALEDNHTHAIVYLKRHESGDWGDLGNGDKLLNEAALDPGQQARILSMYKLPDGQKIYVITEWDRSVTTVLLRSEY